MHMHTVCSVTTNERQRTVCPSCWVTILRFDILDLILSCRSTLSIQTNDSALHISQWFLDTRLSSTLFWFIIVRASCIQYKEKRTDDYTVHLRDTYTYKLYITLTSSLSQCDVRAAGAAWVAPGASGRCWTRCACTTGSGRRPRWSASRIAACAWGRQSCLAGHLALTRRLSVPPK